MKDLYQFGRYLLVGGVMTLLGYVGIFFCMYGLGIDPIFSNIVVYGLGLAVSYWLHRVYTFKSQGKKLPETIKFFVVFGIAYPANLAALALLIQHGVHPAISQILASFIYVIVSFSANKILVFKR